MDCASGAARGRDGGSGTGGVYLHERRRSGCRPRFRRVRKEPGTLRRLPVPWPQALLPVRSMLLRRGSGLFHVSDTSLKPPLNSPIIGPFEAASGWASATCLSRQNRASWLSQAAGFAVSPKGILHGAPTSPGLSTGPARRQGPRAGVPASFPAACQRARREAPCRGARPARRSQPSP